MIEQLDIWIGIVITFIIWILVMRWVWIQQPKQSTTVYKPTKIEKFYPKDDDLFQMQKLALMEIHAYAGIHSSFPYTNVEGIHLLQRFIHNYLFIRDYREGIRKKRARIRCQKINSGELKLYGQ